jgi:hypothetical protein
MRVCATAGLMWCYSLVFFPSNENKVSYRCRNRGMLTVGGCSWMATESSRRAAVSWSDISGNERPRIDLLPFSVAQSACFQRERTLQRV